MYFILIYVINEHVIKFTVFINEVNNEQAAQSVDIALTYIKKNPNLGLSVQVVTVEGNRTESRVFLEASK